MALVYVYNETEMSWEKMKPDNKGLLLQIFFEPQLAWAGFELRIYALNQIGVFGCLLVLPGKDKKVEKVEMRTDPPLGYALSTAISLTFVTLVTSEEDRIYTFNLQ